MKKSGILLALALVALCGCGKETSTIPHSDDTLMSVGDVNVTKGDMYTLIKHSDGDKLLIGMAISEIYAKEVPVNDEIKEEANKAYEELKADNENLDDLIKESGYESKDQYIEEVLIPNIQSQKLSALYFKDNKDQIVADYKPSVARIIQCDDKKKAEDALKALKAGDKFDDVYKKYASETASVDGKEMVVTTQDSMLPTALINNLSASSKDGVIDEIFASDDETSYMVAVLVSNDFDKNIDKYVKALSNNTDLANQIVVSYLGKYKFEVHDQYLFNQLKINDPQYLVTRPDLMEGNDGQ